MSRQHQTPSDTAPVAHEKLAPPNLPALADKAIDDLGNDTWVAHGYRVHAPNRMEARSQLQLMICEEAFARDSLLRLTRS